MLGTGTLTPVWGSVEWIQNVKGSIWRYLSWEIQTLNPRIWSVEKPEQKEEDSADNGSASGASWVTLRDRDDARRDGSDHVFESYRMGSLRPDPPSRKPFTHASEGALAPRNLTQGAPLPLANLPKGRSCHPHG